jgi:hypothetical protein
MEGLRKQSLFCNEEQFILTAISRSLFTSQIRSSKVPISKEQFQNPMTQYVGVLSGDNTSTSYQMDSIIKLQYFLIKMKKILH